MVRRFTLLSVAAVLLLTAAPASAITHGSRDHGEHPYVGELIWYDPDYVDSRFTDPGSWFSCTATMLNATVIVTAGHCTFAVGHNGHSTTINGGDGSGGNDIWFDASEVAHFNGFPDSADYGPNQNQQRYHDRAAFLNSSPYWHRGHAYPHPLYDDANFYVHDAGVVVLNQPFKRPEYGRIPRLDYLDRYQGDPHHLLEVVGYGLTRSGPFTEEGGDVRMKGEVKINSLNASPKDTFILLSDNPGLPHKGGTCFGDSGGPTFNNTHSNLVVAVTSFAESETCSGVGGAYRLDQPDDLRFLRSFGITP